MADLRDQEVIYSGKRFAVRDGEEVEVWEVRQDGDFLTGQTPYFSYHPATGPERYRWGLGNEEWVFESLLLTIDIFAYVLSDHFLADVRSGTLARFTRCVIAHLPDDWVLTGSDVLKFIEQFEAKEVRRG